MRNIFKFLLISFVFFTNIYLATAKNNSTSLKPLAETFSKIDNPSITVSGPLTDFTACSGTASASQTFTVSGSDLSANILITAPAGYEISLSSGSGWGTTLSLTQASGIVASTTIYIRIAATATTITNGLTISIASTGTTTQTLTLNGAM